MTDYFENWLDFVGFGNKDSSVKDKLKHHQDRHVELMFAYQELCQDAFNAMLTSAMKGDMTAVQKTHKEFLEGLNRTFESMFTNQVELASHAPEKMNQMLNMQRKSYEKIFDTIPQIGQIHTQKKQKDMMNNMKKLALGTMSAVLASVAMPSKGLASLADLDPSTRTAVSASVAAAQMEYRSYDQNPLVGRTHVVCPSNFSADQTAPSRVYADAGYGYAKIPMLHPYHPTGGDAAERMNGGIISIPLAMFLTPDYIDNVPSEIKNNLAQVIDPRRVKIMVCVQDFPWNDGTQISFRPHYATDPNAPTRGTYFITRNIETGIYSSTNNELFLSDLVVRPGGNPQNPADYVEVNKAVNTHNPFSITTHGEGTPVTASNPTGAPTDDSIVVLSGQPPFVKGISSRGQSFWSSVTYLDDDGLLSGLATLHLVLNDGQLDRMRDILQDNLPRHGNPINNLLNVVNALQSTREFNDGSEHLTKLADLMGFVSPKIAYSIQQTDDTPCVLDGLSGPEGTHRWSNGERVRIDVPVLPGAKTLSFDTFGYVTADFGQRVTFSVNGHQVNDPLVYDQQHPKRLITTVLPGNRDVAECEFLIPTKRAPGGGDPRELGIAFRTIEESLPYQLTRTVQHNIGQNAELPFELREGEFGGPEATRRWTIGNASTITIPLDADMNRRPHAITFLNTTAYIPGHHTQLVNVKLNGVLIGQYIYSAAQPSHTIKVPIPANLVGNATIVFETPNARSPGADPRVLGMCLRETVLSYVS